jgi:HK97 family phage portal protein
MPSLRQLLRRKETSNGQSGLLRVGFGTQWSASSWGYARTLDSVLSNPTGFRCVEVICSNASRPPFEIRKIGTDERIDDHPLLDVLRHPDERTSETSFQRQMVRDLELAGKTLWLKSQGRDGYGDTGPLQGLKRLPIQQVTVFGNEEDELLGFIYTNRMGQITPLLPEQCLYVRYPHPERSYDGLAPAMMAGLGAETDTVAARFNFDLLSNDAALPGYITLEDLSPDQFAEWKALWESGEPGKTRFLGGKAQYHKVGQTNEELSFKDLRIASQSDIFVAFGVPKVMVSPEDATFANARAARASFYSQTILNKLTLIGDELTLQLGREAGVDIGFDLSRVEEIHEGLAALVERSIPLLDAQVITINEVRKDLGLDPVEWGDEPVGGQTPEPEALVPDEVLPPEDNAFPPQKLLAEKMLVGERGPELFVGQKALPPAPTPEDPTEPEKAPKEPARADTSHPLADLPDRIRAFWDRQAGVIASRLRSREGKSLEKALDPATWWQGERWDSDLSLVTSDPGETNQKTFADLEKLVSGVDGGVEDAARAVEEYFAAKEVPVTIMTKALEVAPAHNITVNSAAPPEVNVTAPAVNVAAPEVNVAPPEVTVNTPEVVVNIPDQKRYRRRVERDEQGRISAIIDEAV